jgi:D-alanyl-D-alanine carboxypeptidase/D-alanyl-D-alanine-endopeptidase (penicillin-binding protein 4)
MVSPLAARAGDEAIAQRLEGTIRRNRIRPEALGLSVVRIDGPSARPVFSHRGSTSMSPASNLKLFSTAAALDRLGPDFLLSAELRAEGTILGGTLSGDLIVVGRGDPGISGRFEPDADPLATFRRWAKAMREKGIGKVAGGLVLDDGWLDREWRSPSWPPAGTSFWYQAPISALPFEDDCVGIRIRPTRPGRPAEITLIPETGAFVVENRTKTVGPPKRKRRRVKIGLTAERERGSNVIRIGGTIRSGAPSDLFFLTVDDPPAWFGAALAETLAAEGIEISGPIRMAGKSMESAGVPIARHETSLARAISVCNKRSQNLFAETLLKSLGREKRQEGSWRAGLAEVEDFLDEAGIPRGSHLLLDGSGISRGSRVTAEQITALLDFMSRHRFSEVFRDSLCVAGEEGCAFGRRLRGNGFARENVWAKTGSILGVRALSGYVRTASGGIYAYSILLNAPLPSEAKARRFQDAVLTAILDAG